MKIAISAQGGDADSSVDPRFGRAAFFVIYDSETETYLALSNTENSDAAHGAGVQAAQLVAEQKPDMVISGNIGPRAFSTLKSTGIKICSWNQGTVKQAVELAMSGKLTEVDGANVRGHWR